MATGVTGRLIRRTTKEPLQGITIEAVDASTGVSASTTTTTDTKGFFELNGLASAVYFAKPLVSGDDWDLLPNIAKVYTDQINVAEGGISISQDIVAPSVGKIAISAGQSVTGAASGSPDIIGVFASTVMGGTGTVDDLFGVVGAANGSTGSTNRVAALVAQTFGTGGKTHGLLVSTIGTGSTRASGVEISAPSSGANNYAIYSETTAQSEFAGSVKSSHATGGIGYATGAGGTVTQLTNKSTGVTLNTISGQITMHNAALGAGALVSFVLTNSAYTTSDTVIAHVSTGGSSASYRAGVLNTGSGAIRLYLENITGGSLSEAVVINFAIIKGATS